MSNSGSKQGSRAPSSFVNAASILACDLPATVVRKLDAAFHLARAVGADTPADAKEATDLREPMRNLCRAYVRLLESGRDRIVSLGGDCDLVDVMEANDTDLRAAREALDASPKGDSHAPIGYMYRVHLKGSKVRGGLWHEVNVEEFATLAVHTDDHYEVELGILHKADTTPEAIA